MGWLDKLRKQLQIKKEKLVKGIESAKRARDLAPSAMESHSDVSRSENEKLLNALEVELKNLEEAISKIPLDISRQTSESKIKEWRYIEVSLGNNLMKLCLVPEGLGGEIVEGVRLISTSSPLGKTILNKRKGDMFSFNNQDGKIVDVQ